MKNFTILFLTQCMFTFTFGQENLLKGVEDAAKKKVEAQDFNTTRSNRERSNYLSNDKKKSMEAPSVKPSETAAPAPAPAPAPEQVDTVTPTNSSFSYNSNYSFESKLNYQMQEYKGDQPQTENITYLFGTNQACSEIGQKHMSMIFDLTNNVAIVLDEDKKAATVISMDMVTRMTSNQSKYKDLKYTITKTGKTKSILGFMCDEYISSSDGSKTEFWITNTSTGIISSQDFANIFKNALPEFEDANIAKNGLMMEALNYDKDGKLKSHILVTELKKEAVNKNIGAYKITDMSSGK